MIDLDSVGLVITPYRVLHEAKTIAANALQPVCVVEESHFLQSRALSVLDCGVAVIQGTAIVAQLNETHCLVVRRTRISRLKLKDSFEVIASFDN